MKRSRRLYAICLSILSTFVHGPVLAEPSATTWMKVGDSVQVDILMAGSPSSSVWKAGKIVEVNQRNNSYIVEVDGAKLTIVNAGTWIKPGQAAAATPVAASAVSSASTPAPPSGGSPGRFNTGDTVSVDRIMSSTPGAAQWTTGKVMNVNRDRNSLDVLTPDGITRTIVNNSQWIRSGTNLPGPAAPAEVASTKPVDESNAGKPEWDRKKGLGTPPEGVYTCHKLSGYVIGGGHDLDLGTLTIQGGNYRGLDAGGNMAPFSVIGEQIQWSRGLEGIPHAWQIQSSKYVGADERGRPLIRIYYRAATRGALECIDCYKTH